MNIPRRGDWIQTFTGKKFFPLDPDPELICLEDIAHSLSLQCRFSGHSRRFYSVAQHSLLVSLEAFELARAAGLGEALAELAAKVGLLHDASEAYLVDVPRPLKRSEGFEAYRAAERAAELAIAERFKLGIPIESSPCYIPRAVEVAVKEADVLLLATEARDLMAPLHPEWEHKPPRFKVRPEHIEPMSPELAERVFLEKAADLGIK